MKLDRTIMLAAGCLVCIPLALPTAQLSAQSREQMKKPLIYQIGQTVHINAGGPRPLLQAIDALQQKYGWWINYEDPQYPASASTPPRPGPPHRLHDNLRQQGDNGFSVEFEVAARPEAQLVLNTVVDAYNQSGGAGQFELRKERDGSFVVTGTGVRGSDGQIANQQPVLDSLINLAPERRSAAATIQLICNAAGEKSKVQISPIIPFAIGEASEQVNGNDFPARTLLGEALAATTHKLYWQLLYNSDSKSYELNIEEMKR